MKPEIKKLLILNLPYLLFVWLFDKVGAAVRLSPGADASTKLLHLGDGFSAAFSSIASSCRRCVFFSGGVSKRNWSTDILQRSISSKKICKLGCCPLFSMFARQHGEINISSLTFLRLSLCPVRAAFIAAPKALKSYFGTGLYAMIIHPITFYCSSFFLDMSTLFYQLAKIILIRNQRNKFFNIYFESKQETAD